MEVLITGARAPVALEWARLVMASGHRVWLADSLHWPLGRFLHGIQGYLKLPPPRLQLDKFAHRLDRFLHQQHIDLLIPCCEEIFYLAQIRSRCYQASHWLMPDSELLFRLHHKYQSLSLLDGLGQVRTPATLLRHYPNEITADPDTILKPVYSRFGRQFIAHPQTAMLDASQINPERPWVQQERISGRPLCNYALYQKGQLIAHQAYLPRYRLNQAAASYFEPITDPRLDEFARQFGQKTAFHGQAAFDFIDQDGQLFCLECNPRATSGLHLLRNRLRLNESGDFQLDDGHAKPFRVGFGLPLMFGISAIKTGRLRPLLDDYHRAEDALHDAAAPLRRRAPWLALLEMLYRMLRWRKPLTDASTFDIEWNGPAATVVASC